MHNTDKDSSNKASSLIRTQEKFVVFVTSSLGRMCQKWWGAI